MLPLLLRLSRATNDDGATSFAAKVRFGGLSANSGLSLLLLLVGDGKETIDALLLRRVVRAVDSYSVLVVAVLLLLLETTESRLRVDSIRFVSIPNSDDGTDTAVDLHPRRSHRF